MKRYFAAAILLFILIPVQMIAQERGGSRQEKLDSILNPSIWKAGKVLCFDMTSVHIGTLSEDDAPVTYHFRYRNVSKQTVYVTKINTSCGCTAAKFSTVPIKPGEKGVIELTFNPFEQVGDFIKDAFIYSNLSDSAPIAKLVLTGKVLPTSNPWKGYPYIIGNTLGLKTKVLQLPDVAREGVRVERLVCVNTGDRALKLSALMLPEYVKFRTDPSVIPPHTEADLVLSIDGRLLPPKQQIDFRLVLDGISCRPSERIIQVSLTLQ
jgi:hypothetical protein